MKDLITIFLAVGLSLFLLTNTQIVIQQANAQNNTSSLDTPNSNENTEENNYVLVFGQRTVGNIDNSTKIVSSIVGQNLIKIDSN